MVKNVNFTISKKFLQRGSNQYYHKNIKKSTQVRLIVLKLTRQSLSLKDPNRVKLYLKSPKKICLIKMESNQSRPIKDYQEINLTMKDQTNTTWAKRLRKKPVWNGLSALIRLLKQVPISFTSPQKPKLSDSEDSRMTKFRHNPRKFFRSATQIWYQKLRKRTGLSPQLPGKTNSGTNF